MPALIEQSKVCIECRKTKPPGAFHVRSGHLEGRMDTCRDCMTARRRAAVKEGKPSILRDQSANSRGELHDETFAARRDQYIILVAAAADRWRRADDQEEQDGAREALLFRCRQLLEAEGLVST
jgi:hypothetical protein